MEFVEARIYQEAISKGVIWNLQHWAIKQGFFTEEEIEKDDGPYCEWVDKFEHAEAIKRVLAYEIAYFVFRRTNGLFGEMTDFFWYGRNRFTNEYREKTGYEIIGNTVDLN